MPLVSDPVIVLPAALVQPRPGPIATTAVPANGTPGALGNTMHGLVNAINIFPKTPLFDTATLQGELTWMQWLTVTQNEAVFKGRANYTAIDKVSKNFFGLAHQLHADLVPGVPGRRHPRRRSTWSQGLSGNAAVALRRQRRRRQLQRRRRRRHLPEVPDRSQVHRLLRQLLDRPDAADAAGGVMGVANGVNASLSDRGWVSLTFKTTF